MQRTRVGIGCLLLFGILNLVHPLLGEWLAPLIEEQFGAYINLWTVSVLFLVIGAVLIGFGIWDRRADQPAATPLSSVTTPPASIPDSNRVKMIDKDHQADGVQDQANVRMEAQRMQDNVVQTYIEHMTKLLLDAKLKSPTTSKEVRSIARVSTQMALQRLDKVNKVIIIRFLGDAGLVNREWGIVDLRGIDLRDMDLSEANLEGADLEGSDLRRANLSKVNLNGAILTNAVLKEVIMKNATLEGAFLDSADLSKGRLWFVNFQKANLEGADLSEAKLYEAKFSFATLEDADLTHADVSGAKFNEAHISSAKFENAIYNYATRWPDTFDPKAAGARCASY